MGLSLDGWIDGISGSIVVILGVIFAIFFYVQGQRKKAKMLKELAFVNLFAGLMYLGVLLDFGSILTTSQNFLGIPVAVPLASYIWFPPLVIVAIYLATSVQYPKYAKYAALAFIAVGAIFYYRMLFPDWVTLNPVESFDITQYDIGGLLDYNLKMTSGAGIWLIIMLGFVIVLFCLGLLYTSTKTTGALKGKFVFLAIGAVCYGISGLLEGYVGGLGLLIIVVRALYSISFLIMYFGLKSIQA